MFKGLGNQLEVVDNTDVLGALGLALAALDALAGSAVVLGEQVVIEFAVAALVRELLRRVI